MNAGDKVYLVCVFSCDTCIRAATVEEAPSVGHDCCATVLVGDGRGHRFSLCRKLADIAESPDAARELMRAQIQKAKDEALAEVARLDAIDVNAVEIQGL